MWRNPLMSSCPQFAGAPMADTGGKLRRLLILGGTTFLGIHMTELALRRGYSVTLFNRGRTHSDLFPGIERLQGDGVAAAQGERSEEHTSELQSLTNLEC